MTNKSGRLAFGSWSTFGQTALLIIAALLVAQGLTVFLVRGIIDEWQRSYVEAPTIRRFSDVAAQIGALPESQRGKILAAVNQPGENFWLARGEQGDGFGRDGGLEADVAEALAKQGVKARAVLAFRHGDFNHPGLMPPPPNAGHAALFGGPPDHGPDHAMRDVLRYGVLLPDGDWLFGRFAVMQSFPLFLNPIFLSQIALFVILLAGTLFWAARISRPLRVLARAAEGLNPQARFEPIAVQGPRDVQVAIASFNTMALRVRELLQEKDRMLAALGHDLRTPLASLRIRAETVEPDSERDKIIETVDGMTAMLDEILALARLGYSTEPRQLVDVSALADAVVEEFASLGKAVQFVDSARAPVLIQTCLVRRLICNLIDNAVQYGKAATVTVRVDALQTAVVIEDEGPGIPAEYIGEMLQPFSRLETSRSRLTGGSGLGLAIADAIARSQGASLILENRAAGGLRATIRWPHPLKA